MSDAQFPPLNAGHSVACSGWEEEMWRESGSTQKEPGGVREWEEASFPNVAAAKGRMKEREGRGVVGHQAPGPTGRGGHRAVQALDVGRTVTLDPRRPLGKRMEQIMLVVQSVLKESLVDLPYSFGTFFLSPKKVTPEESRGTGKGKVDH